MHQYNSQEAETGELFKTVVQMTALYKHYYHMMQRYQKMDMLGKPYKPRKVTDYYAQLPYYPY